MYRRELIQNMMAAPLAMSAAQQTKYQPNWSSIDSRPMPRWYGDAKFGIFIHWGIYSVPAFAPLHQKKETPYSEWYWHSLVDGQKAKTATGPGSSTWAFHKQVYGEKFPYQDFAPMFHAELFNPDEWADLFVKAGAKYVALTSKHHDGFALWNSKIASKTWNRPWNSVEIGPKRDLLTDLSVAGRKRNLEMGIYYSLYEWFNPLWIREKQRFINEHFIPQFKEVVEQTKPSIIFTDGEWELPSETWRATEVLAWLFNESSVRDHVVVNDRWGKETRHKHGGYYTTEYTSGMQLGKHAWEESRGMGFSYGYNRVEQLKDYHTERELILMLIDIVSRGGNLLLDIGPRADGQIPVIMQERLLQIGYWLKRNGEAIYGTEAWTESRQWSAGKIPPFEEKEFMSEYDIGKLVDNPPSGFARVEAFFTKKGKAVYAIVPRWPDGAFTLRKMNGNGDLRVTLVETGQQLKTERSGDSVKVTTPAGLPFSHARTLKIEGLG